jgi:hypothetical protein
MINIVRYSVTVKENGDSFHSSDSRRVIEWANEYENHCLNQDEPWQPHFEFIEEEMN